MSLIERFLKDEMFIDFGAEVLYGDDQMYLDYPRRFATVSFQLMSTSGLCQIADRIRKDLGFVPMHPMDEYGEEFNHYIRIAFTLKDELLNKAMDRISGFCKDIMTR